jgi:endonuclease-3
MKNIPVEDVAKAHHWLLLHGRYVCKSAKPECGKCALADICPKIMKNSKLER